MDLVVHWPWLRPWGVLQEARWPGVVGLNVANRRRVFDVRAGKEAAMFIPHNGMGAPRLAFKMAPVCWSGLHPLHRSATPFRAWALWAATGQLLLRPPWLAPSRASLKTKGHPPGGGVPSSHFQTWAPHQQFSISLPKVYCVPNPVTRCQV